MHDTSKYPVFIALCFCLSLIALTAGGRQATLPESDTTRFRISLLTCGSGLEVWETFGHAAIRVVDKKNHTDLVYNWGTFDGFTENFEWKFLQGKLLYYLSVYPYRMFLPEYRDAGRSVQEQELLLSSQQKEQLYNYLKWNASDGNRYYKYDFFYDNCATRIRDVFEGAYGIYFDLGSALPENSTLTFREVMNHYFYRVHLQRLGVNILLGSRIDQVMSNREAMFLPDFLREGIGKATIKDKKITAPADLILSGTPLPSSGINTAFLLTLIILLVTMGSYLFKPLFRVQLFMSSFVLTISGLLGVIILFMWFGTDHQACRDNYNLLWALPTNLLFVIATGKSRDKYAWIGILLILLSLLLHILEIQRLPLFELGPFLLALLFVFAMICRKEKIQKLNDDQNSQH